MTVTQYDKTIFNMKWNEEKMPCLGNCSDGTFLRFGQFFFLMSNPKVSFARLKKEKQLKLYIKKAVFANCCNQIFTLKQYACFFYGGL